MNRRFREVLTGAIVYFTIAAICYPSPAAAYVDPGSGSVIVTAILGAIGAVSYTFRKYLYRAKNFLNRRDKDK
ncbi:MAG: hypothetical protein U1E49_00300 [Hyphomicrobiaceae bacterium]